METYEIKGFPDYTIDERMEVVSLKYGKRRVIKGNGVAVQLHRDGRIYSFCRIKLLYAALHRLDPSMIDGSRFIVHNENGRVVVDEKRTSEEKLLKKQTGTQSSARRMPSAATRSRRRSSTQRWSICARATGGR